MTEAREKSANQPAVAYDTDWLNAYYDPVAGVHSHSGALELADVSGDGDYKLVAANYSLKKSEQKLKVFKGASLIKESLLVDTPTALISVYTDLLQPRIPAIAVASGSSIYIYKNLRPSFQFTLPAIEVTGVERDIWAKAKQDETYDVATMHNTLEDLRRAGQTTLSDRSMILLGMGIDEARRFVETFRKVELSELKRTVTITCMARMNKSSPEEDAINCLLVGTEQKKVYILDTEAFTILATMECTHVPVFLNASGLYDVEFRIVAACRNGILHTFKRGFKVPKTTITLATQIVGVERSGKNIIVGCMDRTMCCYTTKGKKLWRVEMPSDILTLGSMELRTKGLQAVVVSLANNQVHIYKDKYIVSKFVTQDLVIGVKFGRFGREEANLLLSTKNGGLIIKILKRTAQLTEKDMNAGPPEAQFRKLDVPKKTKLYVDQTTRERENAIAMHQTFQKDLFRFRLKTAKLFLSSLKASTMPVSTNPNEPLKLNAQVQGIGPNFKLILKVQNISSSTVPSVNLYITFVYNDNLYKMANNFLQLPMLVPELEYPFSVYVQSIANQQISDNIKVLLCKKGCEYPIITAVINMPISEFIN